jgi:uncharacterized membrane protein YagU involved in acid resistance
MAFLAQLAPAVGWYGIVLWALTGFDLGLMVWLALHIQSMPARGLALALCPVSDSDL